MPNIGPLEIGLLLIPVLLVIVIVVVVVVLVTSSQRRSQAVESPHGAQMAPPQPPRLVATFGPTTAWMGKSITFENGRLLLQDYGPIAAGQVLEYDRQGHLVWSDAQIRQWVSRLAASSSS